VDICYGVDGAFEVCVFTKFKVEENLEELWYEWLVAGRVF